MAVTPEDDSDALADWGPDHDDASQSVRIVLRAQRRRNRGLRRACVAATAFGASILCLAFVATLIVAVVLFRGPISIDLAPRIAAALNERVGHGFAFNVGATSIEATSSGPALMLNGFRVSGAGNQNVVTSQKAAISVDPLSLLTGRISPRQLVIHDIDLHLLVLASGEVGLSAGAGTSPVPLASAFSIDPPVEPSRAVASVGAPDPKTDPATTASVPKAERPAPGNAAVRALAAALRSLIDATTAPDSAFSALDSVDVTGRLVLDDQTRGVETIFNNTELSFVKDKDGSAVLNVSADGPTGRWSLGARATRSSDDVKMLSVEVHDLSLDVITLAGGLRSVGFDFDMPISATASVRIAPDGTLDQATGRFDFGKGYFKLDDPDHEPLLVDSITGGFHLEHSTRSLAIDATTLKAGESNFVMTGRVDLPATAQDPWTITTQASGTFGTERPGEKPIKIAHAGMVFRLFPGDRRFVIDRVDVEGPDVSFDSFGEVKVAADGLHLANTASVRNMPAKALSRLWPSFIAAPVRAWFLANLRGGTVVSGKSVVNLTDHDLALMRLQHSVPDDHVHLDYEVADLGLDIMPGVPALTAVSGSGVVTGQTSRFSAIHGEMDVSPGRKLVLAGGTFVTPDTDPKPTPAVIDARVTGNIDAVAELLARDALKPYAAVPIDGGVYRGQVEARLAIDLLLGDKVPPDSAKVAVTATATNFSADKLIGKEGLTDATLQFVADKTGVRAKGDGKMYGAPASVELKKPAGDGIGEAAVTLVVDEAARAKAGMTFGRQLVGPIMAHVTMPLGPGDKKQGAVELDFTKCTFDNLVPGFSKPAGRAAKATLSVTQREGGALLDNIVFEGGGLSLRGTAEVDDGGLSSAKLSQVRLSPGDDMKVEAKQGTDGLKLVIRGTTVDARPFLKWLNDARSDDPSDRAAKARPLDLDFHSTLLTGQNKQVLSNVDIRFSRRGGRFRSLQVMGRFGRSPLTIATVEQGGVPILLIKSADAGQTLAFMDLYKRMVGGRLDVDLTMAEDKIEGNGTVHDFTLREDPAIKQLATEGFSPQNRATDTARIDPAAVSFTKLSGRFTKVGDTVTVRDGTFFGPAVGATVAGTMDFGRDELSLEGTFVPLYGVNNLFSQIPLFGTLLGGGEHEGLFGINYRITGTAAAPVLSVNPLSAMAPGFLRKIFGALDSATQNATEPRDRASGPPASAFAPLTPDIEPFQ